MKRILVVGTDLNKVQKVLARLPYDRIQASMMNFDSDQEMTSFLNVLGRDKTTMLRKLDGLIIVSDLTETDDFMLLSSSPVWRFGHKPLTMVVGNPTHLKQTLLERLIGHIDFTGQLDGDHRVFTSFVLTTLEDRTEQDSNRVMVG